MTDFEIEAYLDGYLAGLDKFAWWKDGVEYVGVGETTLAWALKEAKRGNMPEMPEDVLTYLQAKSA